MCAHVYVAIFIPVLCKEGKLHVVGGTANCRCVIRFSDTILLVYNFSSFPTSAGYDYKTTIRDLVFEPSNKMRLQQQCLNIKIVDTH